MDNFLLSYSILFILGIAMAVLYGSIGVGLLIIGTSLIIASVQPQLPNSISFTLRIVSVLPYLLAIFLLYRAWISARLITRRAEFHGLCPWVNEQAAI